MIELLNRILESEVAGGDPLHPFLLMVFGYTRIPIVAWLREQATEPAMITDLGAYPSLGIGRLLDSHKHDIDMILGESSTRCGSAG